MTVSLPGSFESLSPDRILDAVEALDLKPSGALLALNSYENRVYRIDCEPAAPVVAKFYREGRWSDDAILEEHEFATSLADQEIPVVPPLDCDGTLHEHAGFRYAVYPCRGGRWPSLDEPETLRQVGRLVARIHQHGARTTFDHRPWIDSERMGHEPRERLLASGAVPDTLIDAYDSLTLDLLDRVDEQLEILDDLHEFPIHGDLHPGNILQDGDQLHIVDTDDCCSGPAVQDLWMFLSGDSDEQSGQLEYLLEGYETFRDFDRRELLVVEALRTLRLIHYAGWLHQRRQDPAFVRAFPWFGGERYWNEHVLSLREQFALLNEPPLRA